MQTIILIYFGILYGKVHIYVAGKKFPQMISSHNLLFLIKGCMAWSSWTDNYKECKQNRERVGSDKTRFLYL